MKMATNLHKTDKIKYKKLIMNKLINHDYFQVSPVQLYKSLLPR